jgi:sodium transport system ATP-binding protein
LVQATSLKKVFHDGKRGNVIAVDDLSFECRPGRIFGLLGRNGAGKTTTLRMLATILVPTSGTAVVDGHDLLRSPGKVRERIGFLSGDTKLYDRLTGRETLKYFGRLAGLSNDALEARIEELDQQFRLNDVLDVRIGKMSTGMKQKISVARVILHDPSVLILDEPTLGLDVVNARATFDLIQQWKGEQKTIIFSTHIMTEAERLCDELGIIEKGKLFARGSPSGLLETYGGRDLEDVFIRFVDADKTSNGSGG